MKACFKYLLALCICSSQLSAQNITIFGIGRLGLCFALVLEEAGYNVVGVDIREDFVKQINDKSFDSDEPMVNELLADSEHFRATTSFAEGIEFADLYFILVPTNSIQEVKSYDHGIIDRVLTIINEHQVDSKHIVIGSTVFPEYSSKEALPLISNCTNTTLSYNPEFIAQGEIINGMKKPDLVLIGEGSVEAGDLLEEIYRKICVNDPYIARMSTQSAEISKLALNCFVTAKIAFANFVGDLADMTPGADKVNILKTIGNDKRVGNSYFCHGFGFGGTCFPRDNRALGNYATTKGMDPIIFRTTDNANKAHAQFMAQMMMDQHLDEYVFEDVCFKPGSPVPIIEESQKLEVARIIAEAGNRVLIRDRKLVLQMVQSVFGDLFEYETMD